MKRRRSNPTTWTRSPFGLGLVGLAMLGTGIFAAWAWKNMSDRDKDKFVKNL
jgi:hypothetical protein